MSMRTKLIAGTLALGALAVVGIAMSGRLPLLRKPASAAAEKATHAAPALAVSVSRVAPVEMVETLLVTGTLVPREEILVGPEIEGLRIVEVLADEGDRVQKGQVLARLVSDTIEAQIAQNDAAQARARATIAQAKSNIVSAQARLEEAQNAYDRAKPLTQKGVISESNMDQRTSAQKSAAAALSASRDALQLAEAELQQVMAQRRELDWRRGRTEVMAPADGVVSRRIARIGGFAAGASEPMFRIIARGEIELDAEVVEARVSMLKVAQPAEIEVADGTRVKGTIRIVSPEVDRATRLGRIRILIGDKPGLRIGSFATATIEIARSRGLAIPASAVLYTAEGPTVQVVVDNRVATRRVQLGLAQGALVEIRSGLSEGDQVVAKSGTFLRDGDAVRPVTAADLTVGQAG